MQSQVNEVSQQLLTTRQQADAMTNHIHQLTQQVLPEKEKRRAQLSEEKAAREKEVSELSQLREVHAMREKECRGKQQVSE